MQNLYARLWSASVQNFIAVLPSIVLWNIVIIPRTKQDYKFRPTTILFYSLKNAFLKVLFFKDLFPQKMSILVAALVSLPQIRAAEVLELLVIGNWNVRR
jgi:hypothetical protein